MRLTTKIHLFQPRFRLSFTSYDNLDTVLIKDILALGNVQELGQLRKAEVVKRMANFCFMILILWCFLPSTAS